MAEFQYNPRKSEYEADEEYRLDIEKLHDACLERDQFKFVALRDEREKRLRQRKDARKNLRKKRQKQEELLKRQHPQLISSINNIRQRPMLQHKHHHHQQQQQHHHQQNQQQQQEGVTRIAKKLQYKKMELLSEEQQQQQQEHNQHLMSELKTVLEFQSDANDITSKQSQQQQQQRNRKRNLQQQQQQQQSPSPPPPPPTTRRAPPAPTPTTFHHLQQRDRVSMRIIEAQQKQQMQQQQSPSPPSLPTTWRTSSTKCDECGFKPTPSILEIAAKLTSLNYAQLEYDNKCINCAENDAYKQKMEKHNEDLDALYKGQIKEKEDSVKSTNIVNVNVREFITKQSLPPDVTNDILNLCGGDIQLTVTVKELNRKITDYKEHKSEAKKVSCSYWKGAASEHPNTIYRDEATDITFIKCGGIGDAVGSQQNFLALCELDGDEAMINAFCNEEGMRMKKQSYAKRPGPASGYHQLGDVSLHLTDVTQKDSTLFIQSKGETSTGKRAVYVNNDNKVIKTNWTYKAVRMSRLCTEEKQQEAKQFMSYRHILLREAIMYLKVLAAMDQCGIPPIQSKQGTCLPQLKKILEKNINRSVEDNLIEWMCTTGEMRNHQAVACHEDGNTSHYIELYTLFGRGNGIKKKDGFLYLPMHNTVVRIKCNKEGIACNLWRTPHVPDQTRNTNNFSKVHGPMP